MRNDPIRTARPIDPQAFRRAVDSIKAGREPFPGPRPPAIFATAQQVRPCAVYRPSPDRER